MKVDTNGILSVYAKVDQTGQELDITVTCNKGRMSEQLLEVDGSVTLCNKERQGGRERDKRDKDGRDRERERDSSPIFLSLSFSRASFSLPPSFPPSQSKQGCAVT